MCFDGLCVISHKSKSGQKCSLQGLKAIDENSVFRYSVCLTKRNIRLLADILISRRNTLDIVVAIHSIVRFLILLAAAIGILKALATLVQKAKTDGLDQTVASAFLGLYDLQALLGVLIILLGGLSQAIHPIVMIVGLVLAHGLQSMVKRADGSTAAVYRLAFYIIPLVIILVGLSSIGHLPV
jgi:hypothetical protein